MSVNSSEIAEDSSEEREQSSKDDEPVSSSANRELIEEYDEDRMRNILIRWFSRDFNYRLNFPEAFNLVPAHQSANRIWRQPMDYEEVAYRLLGQRDNVEPNVLPAAIIRCYSEIVESASKKFADLQQQLDDNEHHIKVLDKARENGKPPNFLILKTPEVRLFPDESTAALQQSFRKILDRAAQEMLECTLKERHLLRAKLCREAEQLIEDVEKEAMTKWMEAQGDEWNGWDHLYPVTAEVKQGEALVRVKVPLSSNVFRIALKECRSKVSTLIETKRIERTQEAANRKRERKLRTAALAKASALPRQEAEQSIQRRMQDMMKPLITEVRELKEQLQGNRSAPREADAGGAATKSAQKSRSQNTQRNLADTDRDAASEAREGKRKRRKRSGEAMARDDPAPALPSAIESEDRARKSGIKGNGKQGKRRSKGSAKEDHE